MGQRIGNLGRHIAAALGYALVYVLLRKLGFAHFAPVVGFKLGLLLLTPEGYWPAFLVAEVALLAYSLAHCIATLGWAFYLAACTPPIALLMAVVLLLRTSMGGLARPEFRLSSVLTCTLVCSAVLVLDGLWVESLIPDPDVIGRKPLAELAIDYFLGAYTGMVAMLPLMLGSAWEWHQAGSPSQVWRRNRDLLSATGVALAAVIAEVLCLKYVDNAMVTYAGQALLLVPAAYFSLKWGWRGAALMGTITSFAIASLMPAKFDLGTLSSQSMMALTVTTFVILGVQTTKLKQALSQSEEHLRKARLEQHLFEVKLQRSSFDLSYANTELTRAHRHLLLHLGDTHNRGEVDLHRKILSKTTVRITELANSLAPTMGTSHPHAFTEGPIPKLLDEHRIRYRPSLGGQLSVLPRNSLALLYRLACEAVAYLLKETPTDRIAIATRTENTAGALAIYLTVLSDGKPISTIPADRVCKALGTYGLGIEELRTRAQLFNGQVMVKGAGVQVILHQALTGSSPG